MTATLIFYWVAIIFFNCWTVFNPMNGLWPKLLKPWIKRKKEEKQYLPLNHGPLMGNWQPTQYTIGGSKREECELDNFRLTVSEVIGSVYWEVLGELPGIGTISVTKKDWTYKNTQTLEDAKLEAEEALGNLKLIGAVGK